MSRPKKFKGKKNKEVLKWDGHCPLCGTVLERLLHVEGSPIDSPGVLPVHLDRWNEPCPASGRTLPETARLIKKVECDHHWHYPRDLTDDAPEAGYTQAQCCRCLVRAHVKVKRKKSCKRALLGSPLPKVVDVRLRFR